VILTVVENSYIVELLFKLTSQEEGGKLYVNSKVLREGITYLGLYTDTLNYTLFP
jgi:hypothetical protein